MINIDEISDETLIAIGMLTISRTNEAIFKTDPLGWNKVSERSKERNPEKTTWSCVLAQDLLNRYTKEFVRLTKQTEGATLNKSVDPKGE